jgi:hypothetical protein
MAERRNLATVCPLCQATAQFTKPGDFGEFSGWQNTGE